MLLRALKKFSTIIEEVSVERFVHVANTYELRASVKLKDGSWLKIRDYLFADGKRKYAYHWQSSEGDLIRIWDSAPHWPDLTGPPHHCHRVEGIVEPSRSMDIVSVFGEIESAMQ